MKDPRTPGGGAGVRESVAQAARHAHGTSDALPSDDSGPVRQPSLFDDPPDDDVMAGREQAERNSDSWWMSVGLQAIRAIAKTGEEFQAFDLVERYHIPEPDHPNRWGPLFTQAARQGLIVPVGAAPSRRPRTAKSLTRTWRGAR